MDRKSIKNEINPAHIEESFKLIVQIEESFKLIVQIEESFKYRRSILMLRALKNRSTSS